MIQIMAIRRKAEPVLGPGSQEQMCLNDRRMLQGRTGDRSSSGRCFHFSNFNIFKIDNHLGSLKLGAVNFNPVGNI